MNNSKLQDLANFVDTNSALRWIFFLEKENYAAIERESLVAYLHFVLWYLVHGQKLYQIPIVVNQDLKDALTQIDGQHCHTIMYFLADENNLQLRGLELRDWYYSIAVPRYKIAALISQNELEKLYRNPTEQRGDSKNFREDDTITQGQSLSVTFIRRLVTIASHSRRERVRETVSIIGFHRSVLGIGEDARRLFDCMCNLGLCPELVDVSPQGLEKIDIIDIYEPFESSRPTGSIVIFCLPVFEMMRAVARLHLTFDRSAQCVVGYWPWETTALPHQWHRAYDAVDEVWASSKFLQGVYSRESKKPVFYVPLHVDVDQTQTSVYMRNLFKEAFTFLSIFDFNSRVERKNPYGSLEAFQRAFPQGDEKVQLVFKTLHADHRPLDFEALRHRCRGDRRIIIIDGAMPQPELYGLIVLADVYLSLHRSEGFGRPIAEAMLLGTPVVATGWSGCADFLTEATGYPVRSVLRPVEPHEYGFAAGSWAEPDLDHAAELMCKAYADRGSRLESLLKARKVIANDYGRSAVSEVIQTRIDQIASVMKNRV